MVGAGRSKSLIDYNLSKVDQSGARLRILTMYSTPRTMVGRIPEYLENLKVEFDSLAHDVNMYKMQRDDYERKRKRRIGGSLVDFSEQFKHNWES